ncbi:hypothetical protein [Hahella sp. HN01]|uniref:hypothetical protein n=1 Tax=Hahella sp. HN01 TaxID=2847262 RepID=UPI001C1E99F8|nr:hypothetical protein [Hahella sp. HN01]MBU6955740.1 hypothetical protein [Hahella sp. HN01]
MTQTHARRTDPVSSHLAAAANEPSRWTQTQLVALELAKRPVPDWVIGWTSSELARTAKLDRYMVARRLPDAEKAGLVERVGIMECSISGRKAVAWRAVKHD